LGGCLAKIPSRMKGAGLFLRWIFLLAGLFFPALACGQTPSPSPTPAPIGGPASIFRTYDGEILRKGEWKLSSEWDYFDKGFLSLQLDSRFLSRTVSYRVVIPANYLEPSKAKTRYSVIYLLHGLAGHFDNWTDKTKLADYAKDLDFIIVTPEGGDGWYTDSSTIPNDKYESYIIKELIPEIDKKFPTIADRGHRMIAGLSMGGYGSIKFGLKYPELFSLVGSFSGALDAPLRGEKSAFLRPSIISVFGPDDSRTRTDNDIFSLIRSSTPEKLKTFPFIYLDCGTEDSFLQTNRDFDALLVDRKIQHEFRELPGNHSWEYWDREIKEFLRVANARQR
jgi:putative tributyrin esterase